MNDKVIGNGIQIGYAIIQLVLCILHKVGILSVHTFFIWLPTWIMLLFIVISIVIMLPEAFELAKQRKIKENNPLTVNFTDNAEDKEGDLYGGKL